MIGNCINNYLTVFFSLYNKQIIAVAIILASDTHILKKVHYNLRYDYLVSVGTWKVLLRESPHNILNEEGGVSVF